ncbi:MAG TPA: NADPH-dependent F420 reductase [Euzebya sp.]|nr:NADPH-dependent F420 reductase [Euzebya sp.]
MIGIIGGTGPQGQGLAHRLSMAGIDVLLGSRSAEKGEAVAAELSGHGTGKIFGSANSDLPARSDMLLVAVPYSGLADTLGPLGGDVHGSVVMSAVNHLGFKGGPHPVAVDAGSSAQEVAVLLPGARVTTAFNNVSAVHLRDRDHVFDEDVLVCGDDAEAVARTIALVDRVHGLRGVASGGLAHAATIEAMTAVIISINKAHKTNAGLRITGL